jgi:hypothetical protein
MICTNQFRRQAIDEAIRDALSAQDREIAQGFLVKHKQRCAACRGTNK